LISDVVSIVTDHLCQLPAVAPVPIVAFLLLLLFCCCCC